jgi:hypothetical protein
MLRSFIMLSTVLTLGALGGCGASKGGAGDRGDPSDASLLDVTSPDGGSMGGAGRSLSVPIVAQPAEWTAMSTVGPTGTRTHAPVTFGIGIPDASGVDCPGTPGTVDSTPSRLELQDGSGTRLDAQFRCLGRWPSGNAQWVLVDAQLPSFTESAGFDTSLHLVNVASGGGNLPSSGLAELCTGSGAPDPACPDANHILVRTSGAACGDAGAVCFLVRQHNYNLFDDVEVGTTHLVASSNHGANDGLVLLGPSHAQYALQNIDSVSCNPGPIPTNYAGATVCATPYASNLDDASSCTIEENGPKRAALKCEGDLKNTNGDVYMHWRTRMHFWSEHNDAKVTVALRNADVTPGTSPNFKSAYKEFTQFESRLTDNLGSAGSRHFDIANHTATPTTGTLSAASGSDSVYLYQAYSKNGEFPHWTQSPNCTTEQDGCVVSPIPRKGSRGDWTYAANGYQIQKNGAEVISGTNENYAIGWADLDDGSNGIEVGVYQMSMYWPKSLEFQPGTSDHNEIRVGIWPNQKEFTGGTSAVAYAMGWPQYSIHDLYYNFHAGTQTSTEAQNAFLDFQHSMLARPVSGTYYNSVKDAKSGFGALFYDIPDPVAEDNYYIKLEACRESPGQCLGDVGMPNFAYGGLYQGMKIFRYFGWPTAGGSDGTQFEQRNAFLRNWLQRGGAGTKGSVPGRYMWASHWYRMLAERSLPRSDTPVTSGPGAGFRSLCTSITSCNGLSFYPWGDPKNGTVPSAWNGGERNWGDDPNSMEHSVYWGMFTYYFLSGDEWMKEQALQGFKDRYQNPFVAFNNLQAGGLNGAPGHGHVGALRAMGHWYSGAARLVQFLRSIGDPDADTTETVQTSPGLSSSTSTVLQGLEQSIAADIALPYIASGYPVGWNDTTGAESCHDLDTVTYMDKCSQGVNPVRGFPKASNGGQNCGTSSGEVPCNDVDHREATTFMLGIWTEGVYDAWLVMRDLLGPDWHVEIGTASKGLGVSDGLMGPYDVTISEKNMLDMIYAASSQQMAENNCVNTGTLATSGCVYTQFSDYLNSSSACTSSGDCQRDCSTGCEGLTQWFAMAAAASTTNSTVDLAGNPWQFIFDARITKGGILNQELGSHMMQFAMNYILSAGSTHENAYAVSPSIPILKQVDLSVSPSSCVGPDSGTGTCTLTWTAPAGLTSVNGGSYRLKYWACPSPNNISGTDCPSGGKTIVPSLKFHDDITTAGFVASDGTGSWEIDPAHNWNWAFTTDVPDCLPGQSAPECNASPVSGESYTFTTQAKATYTFSLYAYQTGSK